MISLPSAIVRGGQDLTFLSLAVDAFIQVGIDLTAIQEVFTLSVDDLTLMPNMAGSVLGLIHHRNRLLWAVDLGDFLGLLPRRSSVTEYAVAIVFAQDTPIAFGVQSIGGLLRLTTEEIRSLPGVETPAERLVVCAQGYLDRESLPTFLLNADSLIKTVLQFAHEQTDSRQAINSRRDDRV